MDRRSIGAHELQAIDGERGAAVVRAVRALIEELDLVRPRAAKRISLGDHETVLSETGQGDGFILIHSLGADWRVWRDVIGSVSEEHRVIAYDLRGHGYASNAPKVESMQRFVDDLVLLLDQLNIRKARIAGLSLGGAIAQIFALQHPDRVISLSLVSTMARGARELYLANAVAAEREGMAAQVAPNLLRWLTPETVAENPWFVRYLRERVIRAQVPNWAATWRTLAQFDIADQLGQISAATHLIAGEKDGHATSPESMKTMADRIPNAKFSVVPGAPHLSPLAKPHEVATLLSHS